MAHIVTFRLFMKINYTTIVRINILLSRGVRLLSTTTKNNNGDIADYEVIGESKITIYMYLTDTC